MIPRTRIPYVTTAASARITEMVRQVRADMLAQQEAILCDFLCSGAMPRDIAIERGEVQFTIDDPTQPYLLTPRMHFRVI